MVDMQVSDACGVVRVSSNLISCTIGKLVELIDL